MPFYTQSSALYYWLNTRSTELLSFPGALLMLGDNTYGELGINNTVSSSKFRVIDTKSWTKLAAGTNHTVGIRSDGLLFVIQDLV